MSTRCTQHKEGVCDCRQEKAGCSLIKHYVISPRRCPEFGLDNPEIPDNILLKPAFMHEAYHTLFGDKTTLEAIEALEREWIGSTLIEVFMKRRRKV
jgi:hypothetical protein